MWSFNSWNVELELSSFSDSSIRSRDANLKEANFSNGVLKSEEEIKNYSLNETLSSIERAEYLLKNGIPIQKEYVYSSLLSIAKDDFERTENIIFPLILNNIKDENIDLQRKFGESFLIMIKENLLNDDILSQFIPIIKEFLQSTTNKDEDFIDLWILVLNEMIPFLSEETISNQLVSEMKTNIDLSRPTEFREMCARIMGTLSGCVKPTILETIIFPKIVTLCQDTLYNIRKYMSEQLNQIFNNLRFESFMKEIISEYIELIIDEEDTVCNTALKNIIDIIPDIAKKLGIEIIYPTLKTIISEQSNKYFNSIKEKIGLLIWNLKDFIATDELELFLKYYMSVAMSKNEKDCIDFIYNLPCITFISEKLNYEKDKMCEIINFFCHNKSNLIRISISKCFHVLTSIYGNNSYEYLSSAFTTLLKDNDIKVLETMFKNMSNILGNFSKDPTSKFNDIAKEIVDVYNKCKNIAPLNWRAQKYIAKNFEDFPNIFNMDIINSQITPLIFDQLLDQSVVRPIKQIFCRTILIYLKNSKKYEQRDKIHNFLKEMKQSQDYHIRYLFLVICYNAVGVFSSKYFCEYFLYSFIDLYRDPIPNIRIYLCQTLMPIRHCLFLFNDSSIIQKFNIITNSLIIRNSDDIDLNNTNNIIKDILNYAELQKNNKNLMMKPLPKDNSSITLDFFLHNDKCSSKRNSIKPNVVQKNSLKQKSVSKRSISEEPIRKKSSNIKIETLLEISDSKKPAYIENKKFVLPENTNEWYKNVYLTEIYNPIDEINYDNLISEDKIKEKEEETIFQMTNEQIKKSKKDLLEHFKNNNNNNNNNNSPIGKQYNNKNSGKGSNENISIHDVSTYKNNGININSSSIKRDHSIISGKTKIVKNSTSLSIKSEPSYTSQKYKKLGDEKINLKPKISGNTASGKQPVASTAIKKKTDKADINSVNSKKKTPIKSDMRNDTSKMKIENSNINNNDGKKSFNKIETANDMKRKKSIKCNPINDLNSIRTSTNSSESICDIRKRGISDPYNTNNIIKIENIGLNDETIKKKSNNLNLNDEGNNSENSMDKFLLNNKTKNINNSNFISSSKNSSIWSSSLSTTPKSSNPSTTSSIISETNSTISFSSSRRSSIKSSSSDHSISPASSTSSLTSSNSGKKVIRKKIITNSSLNSSTPNKSSVRSNTSSSKITSNRSLSGKTINKSNKPITSANSLSNRKGSSSKTLTTSTVKNTNRKKK